MQPLQHVPAAKWRRYALRHELHHGARSPDLRYLELDPCHGVPLHVWAEELRLDNPEEYRQPPPPEAPSAQIPGSNEKVAEMEARVSAGRSPFHPAEWGMGRKAPAGGAADREVLLPTKIDNGRNHVSVTSARQTCEGVEACA